MHCASKQWNHFENTPELYALLPVVAAREKCAWATQGTLETCTHSSFVLYQSWSLFRWSGLLASSWLEEVNEVVSQMKFDPPSFQYALVVVAGLFKSTRATIIIANIPATNRVNNAKHPYRKYLPRLWKPTASFLPPIDDQPKSSLPAALARYLWKLIGGCVDISRCRWPARRWRRTLKRAVWIRSHYFNCSRWCGTLSLRNQITNRFVANERTPGIGEIISSSDNVLSTHVFVEQYSQRCSWMQKFATRRHIDHRGNERRSGLVERRKLSFAFITATCLIESRKYDSLVLSSVYSEGFFNDWTNEQITCLIFSFASEEESTHFNYLLASTYGVFLAIRTWSIPSKTEGKCQPNRWYSRALDPLGEAVMHTRSPFLALSSKQAFILAAKASVYLLIMASECFIRIRKSLFCIIRCRRGFDQPKNCL